MKIRIEAFMCKCGDIIPRKYTCDGEGISPGLTWDDVPEKTKSFALIMEDLDVPNLSHPLTLWIVYNIPGDIREIVKNSVPEHAKLGTNDKEKTGYSGPCPEPGPRHQRYQIQVFALDTELVLLPPGATKQELMAAMKNHIVTTAEATATYRRHT